MTVAGLIANLESRGIMLSLVDAQIRYRSPKQALTQEDRDQLGARRAEIIDYLATRHAARSLRTAGGVSGLLLPSHAQEMWRAFAGGPQEGLPIALNIGIVGKFRNSPQEVEAAVRTVLACHQALRVGFKAQGPDLSAFLNPMDSFVIEREDLRNATVEIAGQAAEEGAQQFCARLNPIEGGWLTRAKLFALPGGETLAVLSCAHMIADAGTRNILLDEIHDILEGAKSPSSISYHEYSLAERQVLSGPQGDRLIEYWRRWYRDQPTMKAPSDGMALVWGNGIRIVKNFTIPGRVLDKVRALAEGLKATPFLIFLTIFAIAMARWARMERFPIRILGDKRTSLELSHVVGLMFCADALEINLDPHADFETVMRTVLADYDAALALRIPSLHFWAPHCVRPGIEAPDYPNKIPAVFNYYAMGTGREKAEKRKDPDRGASLPWPPAIATLIQSWPRRSSPLFLHVMDMGDAAKVSLHFFQGVVSPADQDSFTAMLFEVFAQTVRP